VASGGAISYTITVTNPQTITRVCEPPGDGLLKPICYNESTGSDVTGVAVQIYNAAASVASYTANSGFVCASNSQGATLTCTNGSIAAGSKAQITLNATAPTLAAGASNLTMTMSVNVNGVPSASIQTTVTAPPVLPDLTVSSFSGPAIGSGGNGDYTIQVTNLSPVSVSNVDLVWLTNWSGWVTSTWDSEWRWLRVHTPGPVYAAGDRVLWRHPAGRRKRHRDNPRPGAGIDSVAIDRASLRELRSRSAGIQLRKRLPHRHRQLILRVAAWSRRYVTG